MNAFNFPLVYSILKILLFDVVPERLEESFDVVLLHFFWFKEYLNLKLKLQN